MSSGSFEDQLARTYDSYMALHMFNAGFPPEDIMLFVAPLIRIIHRTRFGFLRDPDVEDAKAEAFCRLLKFFGTKRRNFYIEEYEDNNKREKQFHYDCWWRVFYAFTHQLRFNQPEALDTDILVHGRLPHPRDVDRLNWLGQVADDIQVMVLEKARFTGSAFGACEYIVRAFLDGRRANPAVIERDYKVGPAEFFIDYCKIMLRKSLYDIRDHPQTYDSLMRDVVPAIVVESEDDLGSGDGDITEYLGVDYYL